MRSLLRSYRALLQAQWMAVIEYRAQIFIWMLSFIFPLVMMVVWLAVVDEVGPVAGWDESDFVSYYVAALVVNYLTGAWIVWDWDDDIRTGDLSFKLLKPLDPFHHFVTETLGWKFFIMLVMGLPLVLLTVISPVITYPIGLAEFLIFWVAIVGGFLLELFMATTFAMVAFFSTQAANLYMLWNGTGQFLSGFIAPLALFPAAFQQVARLLPFRYSLSFPLEILMGSLTWPEIWRGFAVMLVWTAAFAFLYRRLWHRGLRRYEAVGA